MNIFFLHQDMQTNAQYYVDKHVSKMRVEQIQLACFAHYYLKTPGVEPPYKNNKKHENHPSTKWVRESVANYNYVIDMGLILCEEMRHRHDTFFQKTEQVLLYLKANPIQVEETKFTRPKLAMKWIYKLEENANIEDDWEYAIENYRYFYAFDKQRMFKWSKREKPAWLDEYHLKNDLLS